MILYKNNLKILKVIHGFPPDFMAGSEVYSATLVKELSLRGHNVFVFTRIENEFLKPYAIYDEVIKYKKCNPIHIRRVNKPKDYLYRDKFLDTNIEQAFLEYINEVKPDIVHFGHLSHLSINLISIAKSLGKKVVFTLHDFWLFCVKGQLINQDNEICLNPSVQNCQKCSPYKPEIKEVEQIFKAMDKVREQIDIFISPSHTVRDFFIQLGIPESKIIYQKYGFDKQAIKYKKRIFRKNSKIRFGFMGRIIPSKGISVLLNAFRDLPNDDLYIYGSVAKSQMRFLELQKNVKFMGSYDNSEVDKILDFIDILIVPSVWLENSPLVIQEAFLSGVIVITSNIGGMKELVGNNDGFLFEIGDSNDLVKVIKKIKQDCRILNKIKDNRDKVDSKQKDVNKIVSIYHSLIKGENISNLPTSLKRITIDTNPDTCNYQCKMCDTHSIYNAHFRKCRPDMPLDILNKTLNQSKSMGVSEIIPTTMGEPTLYKYFDRIVDFCLHNDIKLNLTTNGSQLFNKKYNQTYIQNRLLPALSDIKISFNSLDSAVNEEIMRNTNTKKILDKIQKLCYLRDTFYPKVSITLQMTFMKSNMESIKPLIKYAIKHKINRIKGHQLWITHKELENEAIYKDKKYIDLWNKLIMSLESYRKKIKLENFYLLESSGITKGECPFLGKELWINYKGDIAVCCAPDKERKKLGDFGNINQVNLSQVLNSAQYIELLQNYTHKEVCQKCLMRK